MNRPVSHRYEGTAMIARLSSLRVAAARGHLLCWLASTMCIDIACGSPPCIWPRGARHGASSLAPSMVSQIESGRLTPSLHTVGRLASALGVPVAALFEIPACNRISISRKRECPVVQFDGSAETWRVLGTGLFRGKIRAVV